MEKKIEDIQKLGQQIWLDSLSRKIINNGHLKSLINKGISGITTNPSIFLNSIKNDPIYFNDIGKYKSENIKPKDIYELLATKDIKDACDLFLDLYINSKKTKGFVSIEVDPKFANNKSYTISEAKKLWWKINKPNLMIKIPATPAGINSIPDLIYQGININMTLVFSIEQTIKILDKFLEGFNKRVKNKLNNKTKLVISFFISRIDTIFDPIIPNQYQGKIAISIAKLAYNEFKKFIKNNNLDKIDILPSILWASTSTKNNNYSDVLYVENLIAKNTINTINEKTLNAFLDHGQIIKNSLENNLDQTKDLFEYINKNNIQVEEKYQQLQKEGINQFKDHFEKILDYLS